MRMFNVLSIDFDYFQNIPYEVLPHYPDGIDLPLDISNIVWASKLAYCSQNFDNVKFDTDGFNAVIETIKAQRYNIPFCIASSHLSAYYYIKEIKQQIGDVKIQLTNVDLHHDILNNNDKVDCGNWIGNLINESAIQELKWIAKPLSQKVYNLNDVELYMMKGVLDIEQIKNESYDAVFICKSNQWVLPYFDSYFKELVGVCVSHIQPDNIRIETNVELLRTDNIRSIIRELK